MKDQSYVIANRDITYRTVRLLSQDGSAVMSTQEALREADVAGLDLVLINRDAEPPVCRLVDLDKYLYEQRQKEKAIARVQRENRVTIKEVQFKPNIDSHDFDTKCRNILKFLVKGNRVKIQVQFKGRERQYTQIGFEIIDRVLTAIPNVELDGAPQLNGNRITANLKGNFNDSKESE